MCKETGKLSLYQTVKVVYRYEMYLDIKNSNYRKTFTKLRISDHHFPIGKYRKENIDRKLRLCNKYTLNAIGDELHILTECNTLNAIGDELHILTECNNVTLTKLRTKFYIC